MSHVRHTQQDDARRSILTRMKVVAVVGVSANPLRPSYAVASFLRTRGLRIIPVNPGLAGQTLFDETVRASVAECPPETDTIDIFRRSEHALSIVEDAVTHLPNLQTVWLQIGVFCSPAQELCARRGLNFVENRCPKIEFSQLFAE